LTAEQIPQYAGQTISCTVCKRQFTVPTQLTPSVSLAPATAQQVAMQQPVAAQPVAHSQQGFAPPMGFGAEGAVPMAQYAGPAGYPPPGYGQGGYAGGPMVSPATSGLAIASLICGLIFFLPILPGLLAVIFGIIALKQTREGRAGGRGLAVAGLVCGAVSLFIWGSCFMTPLAGFNRAMRTARQTAQQVQCSSNLQQIGMGLMLYANNNNGKYPAKLGALIESGDVPASVFVCPHTGNSPAPGNGLKGQAANLEKGGHLSYVYVGQNLDNDSPAEAVVVYEKLGNHGNQGMNVLFKDGHVEWYDATQMAVLMGELNAGNNPPTKK
jgi:prepilin-type processing-associated H-X9-DG protein